MAKLRFKYGTMNSSKTAQLIMTHHNYAEKGEAAAIFKPLLDTRDGDYVKSRALVVQIPAIRIGLSEVGTMFNYVAENVPACVLVDEVQFMSEAQIDELARIVDMLDTPVIAFGLMTDFQTNLFTGSRRLLEVGAVVEEIKTICWHCSRKAVYNMRLSDGKPVFDGDQVQVGGNESYRPVCRCCYRGAKNQAVAEQRVEREMI